MFEEILVWKRAASALRQAVRRLAVETEGAALVEITILAPILLLMVVGTMDLGLGIYRKTQVEHAAQAGAQYAIVNGFPSSCTSSPSTCPISLAVQNATTLAVTPSINPPFCSCPSTLPTHVTCNSTCSDLTTAGHYVTVSATATYTTVAPYRFFPSSFNLAAQATVLISIP